MNRIDADRTASVVYAWGANLETHRTQGWRRFSVKITDDGRLTFGQGAAHDPDAIITCDLEAFQAIGLGELDPAEALADGRSTVQGDLEAAMRAAEILTLPAGYTAAAGAAASS